MPDADSLLVNDLYHPRLRCECCGYRTRFIPPDQYGQPLLIDAPTSCRLCDWENAPVDDNGRPDADAPSGEDRNGGHTLAEAKANFARYLSMYDPAQLEPWMLGPPTPEELALKQQLVDAYGAIDEQTQSLEAWQRVLSLETALYQLEQQLTDAAQSVDDLDSLDEMS